jgi:hypothetical protein
VDGDAKESSINLEEVTMHNSRHWSAVGADAWSTMPEAMSRRLL